MQTFIRILIGGLFLLSLAACQPASLKAPGAERGEGLVQDFSISPNTRMALYQPEDAEADKQPELTFGSMDVHFVTIDDVTYMVDWSDVEDFKSLKIGEKANFMSNGFLAREEKTGKNYRVIKLNEQ